MNKLPIGIQTFRKIVEGDHLYVDKTKHIHDLLVRGSTYFLSRPRRFGKSLLLSTLSDIFQGERGLFRGFWLHNAEYNWEKHPVVKIDFSKKKAEDADDLKCFILNQLHTIAAKYGISLERDRYDEAFDDLLAKLSAINRVVVLVDEYDKPIIDNIENEALAVEFREVLRGFYSVIKACDEYIRFVLLTGVSRFSKAGVFSGLNNLQDISMDARYSALLGITPQELKDNFADRIEQLAKAEGVGVAEANRKIMDWYDGFCFGRTGVRVLNPFSVFLLFENARFGNYWFETATPSYLIKLIKRRDFDLTGLDGITIGESAFGSYDIENPKIMPILYQTGYLTIAEYHHKRMEYTLTYPNFEVKNAMTEWLTEAYSFVERELMHGHVWELIDSLRGHNFEVFFDTLRLFFAQIPYDLQIDKEKYYQTVFYLIFALIGLKVEAEVKTNRGRIDAVVFCRDVFIVEFKLDGSEKAALTQIKEKRYFEKYKGRNGTIYLIGATFADRNVGKWKVEKMHA